MSVLFKLRKNAKFHDGTPVTAKDVKWSLDRAVTVGGFPTFQMKAGSLEKPEQFVVVDDHTFRVDFLRKDKLTLMDLAVPVPCVFNSELVKKHATEKDPWGARLDQDQHRRRRRLQGRVLEARARRSSTRATTTGRSRAAAEDPPRDPARDPVGGQPPRAPGEGRHRHDLRDAAQGFPRDVAGRQDQRSSPRRSRTRCGTSA